MCIRDRPDTWHFPYVNDEMFGAMWGMSAKSDTMLLGRVTYDSFAGAFANAPADDPVAAQLNRPAKVLVSTTTREGSWGDTTVIQDDVVARIRALKEQPGGDIMTTGSITLVRTLLRAGLVDELNLLVHPIVLGQGQRLFDDAAELPLTLTSSATFTTGVLHLTYAPARP